MEDIFQLIQTVTVIVICLAFTVLLLVLLFYKGRKINITVTDRIENQYSGFNSTRSRLTGVKHYAVVCVSGGKKRTYGCSHDTYSRLKKGKSYDVTVKFMHIIKVRNNK